MAENAVENEMMGLLFESVILFKWAWTEPAAIRSVLRYENCPAGAATIMQPNQTSRASYLITWFANRYHSYWFKTHECSKRHILSFPITLRRTYVNLIYLKRICNSISNGQFWTFYPLALKNAKKLFLRKSEKQGLIRNKHESWWNNGPDCLGSLDDLIAPPFHVDRSVKWTSSIAADSITVTMLFSHGSNNRVRLWTSTAGALLWKQHLAFCKFGNVQCVPHPS